MVIKTYPLGIYEENIYVLVDEKSRDACIVDPGGNGDILIKNIDLLNCNVKYILLTHGHFDHVEALKEVDGTMFICADHGNAEQLIDEETGEPFTAHTTNPVPFILVNADPAYKLREGGCLADIAPTLIELMGMQQPADMTGKSLLVK